MMKSAIARGMKLPHRRLSATPARNECRAVCSPIESSVFQAAFVAKARYTLPMASGAHSVAQTFRNSFNASAAIRCVMPDNWSPDEDGRFCRLSREACSRPANTRDGHPRQTDFSRFHQRRIALSPRLQQNFRLV